MTRQTLIVALSMLTMLPAFAQTQRPPQAAEAESNEELPALWGLRLAAFGQYSTVYPEPRRPI